MFHGQLLHVHLLYRQKFPGQMYHGKLLGSCCQNCYGLSAKFQQNPIRISSSRDKATWTNVTWTNVTWTNVNWINVNRTKSQ